MKIFVLLFVSALVLAVQTPLEALALEAHESTSSDHAESMYSSSAKLTHEIDDDTRRREELRKADKHVDSMRYRPPSSRPVPCKNVAGALPCYVRT